jgi:hypothetical protein
MGDYRRVFFGSAGVVALIVAIVVAIGWWGGLQSADGGTVIAVRNGGWLDSHDYREAVQPGSSLTFVGFWSEKHSYPANQRYFKVSARPDADSNEVINVPSKDGVPIGITGTFYFELNRDSATLGQFDDKFGTRTYPGADGAQLHAWDGNEGWNAFLAATMGNLVQNALRQEVSGYACSDLISSCALATNGSNAQAVVDAAAQQQSGAQKIQAIQDAVNASFARDLKATLGGDYFTNIQFAIAGVALPDQVQNAVNDAQAAFAGVTKSQAALQQANIDAQANQARQNGYNSCSTCADIDRLKALPPGITTYAPGGSFAIGAGR